MSNSGVYHKAIATYHPGTEALARDFDLALILGSELASEADRVFGRVTGHVMR